MRSEMRYLIILALCLLALPVAYAPYIDANTYRLDIFNLSNNNTVADVNESSSLYHHGENFSIPQVYEQDFGNVGCSRHWTFDEGNHNISSTNYRDTCVPKTYVMNTVGGSYRYNTTVYKRNNSALEIYAQDNVTRFTLDDKPSVLDSGAPASTNWTIMVTYKPYTDPDAATAYIYHQASGYGPLGSTLAVQMPGNNFSCYTHTEDTCNYASVGTFNHGVGDSVHLACAFERTPGGQSCLVAYKDGVEMGRQCQACNGVLSVSGDAHLMSDGSNVNSVVTGIMDDLHVLNYAVTNFTSTLSDMRLRTKRINSTIQIRRVYFNYTRLTAVNGALPAVNLSGNGGSNWIRNISMNRWVTVTSNGTQGMYEHGVFTNGNPFAGDNISILVSSDSYVNDNNHTWTSPDYETNLSFFQIRCYTSPCENATLYWNGTAYPATGNNTNGGVTTFNVSISIPLLNTDGIVVDWFWGYYNATAFINESVSTQTLNQKWKIQSLSFISPSPSQEHNITATILNLGNANIANRLIEYNGVNGSGTELNNTIFYRFVTAPGAAGTVNVAAFMTITFNSTQMVRSLSSSQTVGSVSVTDCSGQANATLNISLYHEDTLQAFNSSLDATFRISLGNPFYGTNHSFNLNNRTNYAICINPDGDYFTHANLLYCENSDPCEVGSYDSRLYWLWNYTLPMASTQQLSLFIPNASKSREVIFTVKDDTDKVKPNHLISVLRWYPNNNTYRIVERVRTDINGKAVTKLVLYDIPYKFMVEDPNGNLKLVQPDAFGNAIYTTEIDLIIDPRDSFLKTFKEVQGIDRQLVLLNDTGTFRLTYVDSSGVASQVCLEVNKRSVRRDELICRNCLSDSTGVILCTIGTGVVGNYVATAYVDSNTEFSNYVLATLEYVYDESTQVAGALRKYGLFLTLLVSGTLWGTGAVIVSASFGLMLAMVGVVIMKVLGVIAFGWTAFLLLVMMVLIFISRMREDK